MTSDWLCPRGTFISPIKALKLPRRVIKILRQKPDIVYIGDLIQVGESEMRRTPRCGRVAIKAIRNALHKLNLDLGTRLNGDDWIRPKTECLTSAPCAGTVLPMASKGLMKPVQPDAVLADILGSDRPLPRTEITKKLWVYIKKHGLQDSRDKRVINADDLFVDLFNGKRKATMFEMAKYVSDHVR